jgi:hypothetical protein
MAKVTCSYLLELTLYDPSMDPAQLAVSLEEVVADLSRLGVEASKELLPRSLHAMPSFDIGAIVMTLAPTIGPVLGTVLGAWLQSRRGRKVSVKFGGLEVEAQTTQQVETLLERIKEFQQIEPPNVFQQSEPKEAREPEKVTRTKETKKADPDRPRK